VADHTHLGQIVLDVDETLCDADPEVFAAIRRSMPPGERDQTQAAQAHTARLATAVAGLMGKTAQKADFSAHPAWIRLGAIDAIARWVVGSAQTCPHCPPPDRPGPIVAAAWMPGTVVCPGCTELTNLPAGSVTDRTCDGCAHECAGLDYDDPIRPLFITCGVLTFMAGVCSDCSNDFPQRTR
jgi:hypothetical protein